MDAFMVQQLLPVLTGHWLVQRRRAQTTSPPARLGGIGFPCVKDIASQEFEASRKVTAPQVKEILVKVAGRETTTFQLVQRFNRMRLQ